MTLGADIPQNAMAELNLSEEEGGLLPVTLLCGFLGAGKTTLLKHVLETKHGEEDFRCAVIVNDMASLNIDKSLIDQSALVQSDEVIAMQNGCFCCTLQSDLVDQIKSLAEKQIFDYMLIEASGVSEPSQIAPLFDLCDDEHDHEREHNEGPQLGEVARLDTCVTVVDAADFHNNLDSMKRYENGEMQGTIVELLMEQVEYSNVIVLNKQDLVSDNQQQDILDRLAVLNPNAHILKSTQSQVNVMDILNTHRFKSDEVGFDSVMLAATRAQPEPEPEPACCTKSVSEGKVKCCKKKAKNDNLIDTGLSQVLLGVVPDNPRQKQMTRHEKRFGITSFVYRARRPFHPGRLHGLLMDPYFMCSEFKSELEDSELAELHKDAMVKRQKRIEFMGELLRSKGFMWIASTHWVMGSWQQAGNILRVDAEGPWMCEEPELWEGTPSETEVIRDMIQENGEKYMYGDRRQELVFIGVGLKNREIQVTLDECLLTDEEMILGPDKWEIVMAVEDRIRLSLKPEISLVPGETHEEFWGITLSEDLKNYTWFPPPADDEDDIEYQVRLTQVCLGRDPKEGERNLVEVIVKDNGRYRTTSIASLRVGPVESMHLDLVFTEPFQFSLAQGSGPVSLSGVLMSKLRIEDEDEDDGWEDIEDFEEEELAVEDKKKKNKPGKKSIRRMVQQG